MLQKAFLSADGISDRVKGEHPWWCSEGTAPQHGLQPERPLPPALLCHTEGPGIEGQSGLSSNTNHFFNWLVFILTFWVDFSAFAVSWTAVWGGDRAVCWPVPETVEELQQQHKHHQSPRQCFPLPTYEAKLWDWQCKYNKCKAMCCPVGHFDSEGWTFLSTRINFYLFMASHGPVFRTLQESRCRWQCHFHLLWERLKILMRSFYVALWRPSSPMQKKTWSWERLHFQTRYRFLVRLPYARPSAPAVSCLLICAPSPGSRPRV